MNKRLVKVAIAFGLMNQGEVYEADIDDDNTKHLLSVGYLVQMDSPEKFFVAQPESEIEGTSKVGGSAPRAKKSGSTSTQ